MSMTTPLLVTAATVLRINKKIDHTFAYYISNSHSEWKICNFQTHADESCSFSTTRLVHGDPTFYRNYHLTKFSLDAIIHLDMKTEEIYMSIANWVGSVIQLDACAAEMKGNNEYEIHGSLLACYDCHNVYVPCDECFASDTSDINGVCVLDMYTDEDGYGEYSDKEEEQVARERILSHFLINIATK